MYSKLLVATLLLQLALPTSAAHRDVAPLSPQAVQRLVKDRLGSQDRIADAAQRHVRETEQLLQGIEADDVADRTDAADAKQAQLVAKRFEFETLRGEMRTRLANSRSQLKALALGDKAAEVAGFEAKLEQRFQRVSDSLQDVERAKGRGAKRSAVARAKALFAAYARAGGEERDAGAPAPVWRQEGPLEPTPQPAADQMPRHVSDLMWMMQRIYAAREAATSGGFIKTAASATPAEASSCGYVAADLVATEDAPKDNADIQKLAGELGYSPARIFEWVQREIRFEPYYGALKGALGTLQSKAGGATDIASLTIALLRASNIPARYVKGDIYVGDNSALGASGRGPRWIGAKSYLAAASILGTGLNPNASYGNQGIYLTHVWVEACVPYGDYRGVGVDLSGHRWVPLDASFKDKTYQPGIALDASFDFNYSAFLASRLDSQGRYLLPQEQYEQEVEAHAKSKGPRYGDNTLEDVPYAGTLARKRYDILPISLPYEVKQFNGWTGAGTSAEAAALPESHRYKFEVTVKNSAASVLGKKTLALPVSALQRVTLSFKGATLGDQTALDSFVNAANPDAALASCATTINVVPAIKLDGVEQALDSGSGSVNLCTTNNLLDLKVLLPELGTAINPNTNRPYQEVGYTTFSNIGGYNYHALQAYARQASDGLLAQRSARLLAGVQQNQANANANAEELEGEFLHIAGLKYMRYVADSTKRIGELNAASGEVGTSLGLVSGQVKVKYVLDLPYAVYRAGFLVDMPGLIHASRDLSTGSSNFKVFRLSSYAASSYEAYIWNENALLDAVSTVRGIQFAREPAQNIEILTVNSANWATESLKFTSNTGFEAYNYSAAEVTSLNTNWVSKGYTLTIPRRKIQYQDWKGTVYMAENQTAGTIGAIIGGGYAGGVTVGTSEAAGGSATGIVIGNTFIPSTGSGLIAGTNVIAQAQQDGFTDNTSTLGTTKNTVSAMDPVNMLNGNMYHSERDLSLKGRGGLPLVFERWYNSTKPADGPLGYGWTHSFNHYLRFYGVEGGLAKLGWTDGTAAEKFFATSAHVSGNWNTGTHPSPAGVYVTFERLADGTYRLTEKSGLKYVFESVTANSTACGATPATCLKAKLLSITDRNGNALTLTYVAGRLDKVTDSLGRQLSFTYDANGKLSELRDFKTPTARLWQFKYEDGQGNLTKVINPAGGSNTYTYYTGSDGANLNHTMKEYKYPRGNGMKFEYYSNGRVFRHTPIGNDAALRPNEATTFTWNEFRREAKHINGRGFERAFYFDAYGNAIKTIEEDGAEHDYTYYTEAPATVNLRKTYSNPQGQVTQYQYDAQGQLTQVTLASGNTLQYADHTGFAQPQRMKDARGNWTWFKYSAAGNLSDEIRVKAGYVPTAGVQPPSNQIVAWTQYETDAYGNPTKVTRVRDFTGGVGPSLEYAYDAAKLNVLTLTRRADLSGDGVLDAPDVSPTFTYDSLGRQKTGIDGRWYATQFDYDDLNRLTLATDGLGKPRSYTYDANGNPLQQELVVNGSRIDASSASFDPIDRKTRALDAAGNLTAYEYDSVGNVVSVANPDGYRIGFDYDPMNRVASAYDEEGNRVETRRDLLGRVRTVTDPNGNSTTYDYWGPEKDGRLKRITQAKIQSYTAGRASETDYDANGNPTKLTAIGADASTRDGYRYYDELNRLTRAVGPTTTVHGGASTRLQTCYKYSNLSDVTEVWAGPSTDTVSNVCNFADATLKRQTTASYDDLGRKLSQTDQLNRQWTYGYDLHGNLTASRTPNQIAAGQTSSYSYDPVTGLLATRTTPNAQTVTYTRNDLGQVTRAETKDAANALIVAYDYSYDTAHRLKTVTDSRGSKTLNYSFSPGGWLSKIADSDGHTNTYRYDAVGRLQAIVAPNGESTAYLWDAGGRLKSKWLPNGVQANYTWNADNSLAALTNKAGATQISNHAYSYDAYGNRSTQAETIAASTKNWTYQYDALNRVTQASDGTATNWTWDIFGNRRSQTLGANTLAYLNDDAHQLNEIRQGTDAGLLLAAFKYDQNGNLTKKCDATTGGSIASNTASDCTVTGAGSSTLALAYDALDQLVQANKSGQPNLTFAYDDQGRRIKKTGASTTYYLYNGSDIHAEYASPAGMPSAVYAHGPNMDDPIARLTGSTNTPNATAAYYHQDGLGSAVATTDAAGITTASQRFDAWGNKLTATGTVPQFGYTGREPDESGLEFYRARYYDPQIGRFVSRDPLGGVNGFNEYLYAAANPLLYIDPEGTRIIFADASSSTSAYPSQNDLCPASCHVPDYQPGTPLPDLQQKMMAADVLDPTNWLLLAVAKRAPASWISTETRLAGTLNVSERAGVANVWSQGPATRGVMIENAVGRNVPQNFPVIDRFENGVATSIKSLDLNAKTYANPATLERTVKGYVDKVANFQGDALAGTVIRSNQIQGRALELAIPQGAATAAQRSALDAAIGYGQQLGVSVRVIPVR